MSRPYSETIAMQPAVSYILYTASSHEQTGDLITFALFEEGTFAEEDESISASIDESYTYYDSY